MLIYRPTTRATTTRRTTASSATWPSSPSRPRSAVLLLLQVYTLLYQLPLAPLQRLTLCTFPADVERDDIITESLDLFRANSLFRNFEIKGPADRVLIYLILFVGDCLTKIAQCTSRSERWGTCCGWSGRESCWAAGDER